MALFSRRKPAARRELLDAWEVELGTRLRAAYGTLVVPGLTGLRGWALTIQALQLLTAGEASDGRKGTGPETTF